MKITKNYLKRIIKEEMRRVLREQEEGSGQMVYLVMGEDHVNAFGIELMSVHRTIEDAKKEAERLDSEQEKQLSPYGGDEYDFQVRSISPKNLLKYFESGTTLRDLTKAEDFYDLFQDPDEGVFDLHKESKQVAREDYATFSAKLDAKRAGRDKKLARAEREREEYFRQNERKIRKTRGKMISAKRRR